MDAIGSVGANIENPLEITDISAQIGFSARELRRRFNNKLQITPVACYTGLRLTVGPRLIKNTGKSINDIAIQCGYNFGSAFSRVFRAHFGHSPTDIRR